MEIDLSGDDLATLRRIATEDHQMETSPGQRARAAMARIILAQEDRLGRLENRYGSDRKLAEAVLRAHLQSLAPEQL